MRSLFVFLLILPAHALSQELSCRVTLNVEGIPSSARENLRGFQADVERYVNGTRYTTEDLGDEKITCSLEIFFKGASAANQYTAQVFVSSQRPIYVVNDETNRVTPVLRILDEMWNFTYIPNQRMIFDEFTFDPLTDFLDFYAFVIIGFDMETYVPLSGSRYFQKALNICNQANATPGTSDWKATTATYSRAGFADELNNIKTNSMRQAFCSYHYDGIDLIGTDPKKGLDNILKSIQTISDVRRIQNPLSVFAKQFFDAKNKEIADVFLSYPDRSIYDRLSDLDQEHRKIYQEYKVKP